MSEILNTPDGISRPLFGVFLVCTAALLWGTVGIANGMMQNSEELDPSTAGIVRAGAGALLLFVIIVGTRQPIPQLSDIPVASLLFFGLCGAMFQISLFEAFEAVGVTITVSVTVCAPPLIVAVSEAIWLRKPPPLWTVLALALAVAGVILVTFERNTALTHPGPFDLRAVGLLASASFAFAGISLAARSASRNLPPLCAACFGLLMTAIILVGSGFAQTSTPLGGLEELDARDIAILGFIGFAATGGAYFAFFQGMKMCSSVGAGLAATMIEPVFAALLAAILLQETLTAEEKLGCAMMLLAMLALFRAETRISQNSASRGLP